MSAPSFQRSEWGRNVLSRWLDADFQIRPDTLRGRGWIALPVGDMMSPMEAEWLADGIQGQNVTSVVGLAFEYQEEPHVEEVAATRDHLLAYNVRNCWRYVLLTSHEESFIYYKDDGNRFFLLCGDAEFVSQAYRCSLETARIMYFEQWVDADFNSDEERRFLTRIWNKYSLVGST